VGKLRDGVDWVDQLVRALCPMEYRGLDDERNSGSAELLEKRLRRRLEDQLPLGQPHQEIDRFITKLSSNANISTEALRSGSIRIVVFSW
jgi:hypothetical protein